MLLFFCARVIDILVYIVRCIDSEFTLNLLWLRACSVSFK
jgi:hypothetical protein